LALTKQSSSSKSLAKESPEVGSSSSKLLDKGNMASKRPRLDVNINEEIKFAKSVVGREGTPTFNQFIDFLIKGEGIKYLEVLKRNGINLSNMSSILSRSGANARKAFKDLYDLWFDVEGNKTQYLRTLEKERVNLSNISSILSRSGANAPRAFKDLYDLWFDVEGNKTVQMFSLRSLETHSSWSNFDIILLLPFIIEVIIILSALFLSAIS
jgi:hypothetical protein